MADKWAGLRRAAKRGWMSANDCADLLALIDELDEVVAALKDLVKINEDHNAAMQAVVPTPPGWSDAYLDPARDAIRRSEERQEPSPDHRPVG